MQLTSNHPFWGVKNGLPQAYPALDESFSCEALVIGGGITGALISFYLAEAGIDTVLIDKRDIGTGSTSASTGLLQYEVDVPLRKLIRQRDPQEAIRSYQLCGEAITKLGHLARRLNIECDFQRRPSLFLARHQKEIPDFKEELELRRAIGFKVQFLDEEELKTKFHFDRPAALFSQLGGQVDPHRLTYGLLGAAARRGLKIFDRTAAEKFSAHSRGTTVETSRGHTIRARKIVFATGFESLQYVKGEAGSLKSTYALVTEPLQHFPDWYRRSLIWESGTPYLYLRPTADNRIIVGGEDVDFANPVRRDRLIPEKTQTLLGKFRKLFPETEIEVAYAWAGTFGETKDGIAYIGENEAMPNAYFALGYGGNGITYSVIAAEIIRDAVLKCPNPDAPIFRFGR